MQPLRLYARQPLQDLARPADSTRLFGPEIAAELEPVAAAAERNRRFQAILPAGVPAPGPRRYRGGTRVLGSCKRLCRSGGDSAAVRVPQRQRH